VYTLGRLSGSLPPIELASLDLRQLALLLCIDLSQNDNSSRRQMSADVLKTARQIASEQPLNVSAVASLSGVGTLLVHSWSTPVNAQNRFLKLFLQRFTAGPAAAAGAAVPVPGVGSTTLLAAVAGAGYEVTGATNAATKPIPPPAASALKKKVREARAEIDGEGGVTDCDASSVLGAQGVVEEVSVASTTASAAADVTQSLASLSIATGATSSAGAVVSSVPSAAGVYPIKKWVRLARVVYGVPHMTYADA
jgi:hypothetical protein